MTQSQIPQWVIDYIGQWRDILYLQGWETATMLSPTPDGDKDNRACVEIFPETMTAYITIRDDIPAELDGIELSEFQGWQKTIIHELLHIRMAGVTTPVEEDIISELHIAAQMLVRRSFNREVEQFVNLMAQILHKLANPLTSDT